MPSRRDFIKYTIAIGAGMFLTTKVKLSETALAQTAGPDHHHGDLRRIATNAALAALMLDPTTITKYATQLVIPPAMPKAPKPKGSKIPRSVGYYQISVQQFSQQILPPGLGSTTVWSYGSAAHPGTHNYPAFTIEADVNKPVRVQWINGLVAASGNYLPHLLPVDQTLHWANPPGPRDGHGTNQDPYTGPVPMVTHVHGAHTTDESDGYAEAWYLPKANNIPPGYAKEGTWYNTFKAQFEAEKGEAWLPGSATFEYPNSQRPTTLWYHDHSLGMTRLNVYAGPAGFYLLRDGPDDKVKDNRTHKNAKLPGPPPKVGSNPFGAFFEIPIAIQDRTFKPDGQLFYPENRAYFEGLDPAQLQIPFAPEPACGGDPSDVAPIWNPEFFGNTIVVNGRTWPSLNVQPRRYRFRFLNGCQARTVILKMVTDPLASRPATPARNFWQIGAEGGFLPAPAELPQLLMAGAERADVIVDFTGLTPGTVVYLINEGPDEPYNGGGQDPADRATTGQVMRFVVVPLASTDNSTPPQYLELPARTPLGAPSVTRKVSLNEMMSETVRVITDGDGNVVLDCDSAEAEPFGPTAALLGTMESNGSEGFRSVTKMWVDPITENPAQGATELWEIYNYTIDAHPIHVHEVQFEVVNRQPFDTGTGVPVGPVRGPQAWETGTKDTVIALPGEVTRIKARFDLPGLYVWHCHIVEHEDNEMMRPLTVGGMPALIP